MASRSPIVDERQIVANKFVWPTLAETRIVALQALPELVDQRRDRCFHALFLTRSDFVSLKCFGTVHDAVSSGRRTVASCSWTATAENPSLLSKMQIER
jgi:hypothetical protein